MTLDSTLEHWKLMSAPVSKVCASVYLIFYFLMQVAKCWIELSSIFLTAGFWKSPSNSLSSIESSMKAS